MPNVALDILVNVVRTKILLIFILLSSLVFIFVLVLVSSTIIQNVFVIFVIVFVVVDEKTLVWGCSCIQSLEAAASEAHADHRSAHVQRVSHLQVRLTATKEDDRRRSSWRLCAKMRWIFSKNLLRPRSISCSMATSSLRRTVDDECLIIENSTAAKRRAKRHRRGHE